MMRIRHQKTGFLHIKPRPVYSFVFPPLTLTHMRNNMGGSGGGRTVLYISLFLYINQCLLVDSFSWVFGSKNHTKQLNSYHSKCFFMKLVTSQ